MKGDDVWNHLTVQAHADKKIPDTWTINEIVNSWITKDRLPVVSIDRDYTAGRAEIVQKVYLRERPHDVPQQDKMLWWIPLVVVTQDNLNFNNATPFVWIQKEAKTEVGGLPAANKFIIANPEEIGPFPVNYDIVNWNLLAEYLQTDEGRKQIPTNTR